MSEQIMNANITIAGVEDTGSQIKIKDENKKTYSFFKTKKDGSETVAFQQFKEYKVGERVGIGYKEVPYKDGTIRNLMNFGPVREGVENARPEQSPQQSMERGYAKGKVAKEMSGEDTSPNWDNIAVGKCQTAFLAAYIQSGKGISDAMLQVTQARRLAELVVYGKTTAPEATTHVKSTPESFSDVVGTPADVVEEANRAIDDALAQEIGF